LSNYLEKAWKFQAMFVNANCISSSPDLDLTFVKTPHLDVILIPSKEKKVVYDRETHLDK